LVKLTFIFKKHLRNILGWILLKVKKNTEAEAKKCVYFLNQSDCSIHVYIE